MANKALNLAISINQKYKTYNTSYPDLNKSGCTLASALNCAMYYNTPNSNMHHYYNNCWSSSTGMLWGSCEGITFTDTPYSLSTIKSEIDAGRPVIVKAKKSDGSAHWVTVYGYTNDAASATNVLVMDSVNDENILSGIQRTLPAAMNYSLGSGTWSYDYMKKTAKS